MNHALIGQIAGVLAFAQVIPYIVSILRGHTKPERMTYSIWFVVEALTVLSYIAVGARTTIWVGLAYILTALTVLLLSIKHGMGGWSKLDVICLLLSVAGIAIWVTTSSALLALCFNVFAGKVGYLPTIKKAYFYPETENTLSWVMTSCTGILNVFALTTLAPSIAILPITQAIFPAIVAYLLLFPVAHHKLMTRRRARLHAVLTHPLLLR